MDGGTVSYTSLNYKIIRWNQMFRKNYEIHLFPFNFLGINYYDQNPEGFSTSIYYPERRYE